jgi:hypothetical protein
MLHEEWMDTSTAKVGDLVRGDFIEQMMCALPPVRESNSCSQMGEPYGHKKDEQGRWRPLYLTWHLTEYWRNVWDHESIWTFDGACFRGENVNQYPKFA